MVLACHTFTHLGTLFKPVHNCILNFVKTGHVIIQIGHVIDYQMVIRRRFPITSFLGSKTLSGDIKLKTIYNPNFDSKSLVSSIQTPASVYHSRIIYEKFDI